MFSNQITNNCHITALSEGKPTKTDCNTKWFAVLLINDTKYSLL